MSRANMYAKYESRKRIPTAASTTAPAATSTPANGLNVDDRLNQIQDYIRITTTLLDSIQGEKVSGHKYPLMQLMHLASMKAMEKSTTTPKNPVRLRGLWLFVL